MPSTCVCSARPSFALLRFILPAFAFFVGHVLSCALCSVYPLSLSPLLMTYPKLPHSFPLPSLSSHSPYPFLVIFLQPLSSADLAFLVLHPDPRQIPNLQKGLHMLSEGMSRVEKSGGGMSPFLFRLLSTTYVTLCTN